MLRHRVPSAVVMVAGLLAVLWADGALALRGWMPGVLLLLFLLVPAMALASREIGELLPSVPVGTAGRWLLVGGVAGLLVMVWPALAAQAWLGEVDLGLFILLGAEALAVLLGWMVLAALRQQQSAKGTIAIVGAVATGFVFLGLLMGAWFVVRGLLSPWGMAGAVMVIKCCDIGAYFTGRFLGRHKLIVWLSPGKTWEGLVGGMAVSAAVAVGLCALVPAEAGDMSGVGGWPWWYAAVCGAVLGYVGQLGDLFASALKRDAGVKDFAKTIPGFGGVMDVIDSLLLAGPVVVGMVALGEVFA